MNCFRLIIIVCLLCISMSSSYAAPISHPAIDVTGVANGSFELSAVGTTQPAGWTFTASRFNLGTHAIAGCTIADDSPYAVYQTYTDGIKPTHDDDVLTYTASGSVADMRYIDGKRAYKLSFNTSQIIGRQRGFYLAYGPQLVSAEFAGITGQIVNVELFGKTTSASLNKDIIIAKTFLVDVNTCTIIPLQRNLNNNHIWSPNQLSVANDLFIQASATIPDRGTYRLAVIAGVVDANGDTNTTAELYVDHATFGDPQTVSWTSTFSNIYIGQAYDLQSMTAVDTGLPLVYRAAPSSVCLLETAIRLRLVGHGDCFIQVVQVGDRDYAAGYSTRMIDSIPKIVVTPTFTNTHTPSHTRSRTNTATPTHTRTNTLTATHTRTHTATATKTNTRTSTHTSTATNTPTATKTATNSHTPTNTTTPISPTSTSTSTRTATATFTATNTRTHTATNTATNTATDTSTRTATATMTHTATNSATSTITNTRTNTATITPTFTKTKTSTRTIAPIALKKAAIGNLFVLGLLHNGTLVSWGKNDFNQADFTRVTPVSMPTNKQYIDVGTALQSSYSIDEDGNLYLWGINTLNELNAPTLAMTNVKAISTGGNFAIVLKNDGTMYGWGANDDGQINIPIGLNDVAMIDGGSWHTVALKNDGTVVAWGLSRGFTQAAGECQNYYPYAATVPAKYTDPLAVNKVVEVAAGQDHTLVLLANGTVEGWGCNDKYQRTIPIQATNVIHIAAGRKVSLALRADGSVVTWGQDVERDFSGSITNFPKPVDKIAQVLPASIDAVRVDAAGQNSIIGQRTGRVIVGGNLFNGVHISRTPTKTVTNTPAPTQTRTATRTRSATRTP